MVLTAKTTPLLNEEGVSLKTLSLALNQRFREVVFIFLTTLFLPFLVN
jgi:hypothetical protein